MIQNSDVELTNEEIAEALLSAKTSKSIKIQYEENEKLRRKKSDEVMKPFNTDQLIMYCKRFFFERTGYEFEIDDQNKRIIEKLSLYFTDNEEFNCEGYSLSKGLLIMGNVGTGKTDLMKFFQKNKKRCYRILTCNDVSDDYLFYKEELENIYSTPIEKPLHDPAVFFQKFIGNCFDDLGTEENKNAYGNKKNVMGDLIMAIYAKKDFEKFHITTNLTKEEIEARYGTRVVSRIREMFNVFSYTGKDRRRR